MFKLLPVLPMLWYSVFTIGLLPSLPMARSAPTKFSTRDDAIGGSMNSTSPIEIRAPPVGEKLNIKTRGYYRKWMIDFYPSEVKPEDEAFFFKNGSLDKYLGRNLHDDWDSKAIRGKGNVGVYEFTGSKKKSYIGYRPDELVVKVLRQTQFVNNLLAPAARKPLDGSTNPDLSGIVLTSAGTIPLLRYGGQTNPEVYVKRCWLNTHGFWTQTLNTFFAPRWLGSGHSRFRFSILRTTFSFFPTHLRLCLFYLLKNILP
ncbi:hypothetical protein F5890DRAFT_1500465 [Lentinula detonsa]|uniref:Uncharacterized protein n=1 Tax=Lentinula detonsa TaxID=2804962 RepID=A0AA38UVE4_9AGAR|nr:hypothetical protein F5890DRAFT_1500465 [Lentinula detonsa]